ncbi:hypothetical protein A2U01_0065561, partial [Trifolium medium]|nr:hypothetical protein [Trifolium medium]
MLNCCEWVQIIRKTILVLRSSRIVSLSLS